MGCTRVSSPRIPVSPSLGLAEFQRKAIRRTAHTRRANFLREVFFWVVVHIAKVDKLEAHIEHFLDD